MNFNYISLVLLLPSAVKKRKRKKEVKREGKETVARKFLNNSKCERKERGEKILPLCEQRPKSEKGFIYTQI